MYHAMTDAPMSTGQAASTPDGSLAGCVHPFPAVRLRGLPFGSSKEEIAEFLGIVPIDIVFQERGGRPNGVAFVLCATPEAHQQAIAKDKEHMGTRYIEVFACLRSEFHRAVADEVADTMRPRDGYGSGRGGGAPGFRDRPGFHHGERGNGAGGGGAGGSGFGTRALPPPLPQDPTLNPRGVEAIAKLRGLPFDASPRDVMEWVNAALQKREVLLSGPVGAEDVVVATKNGTSIGVAFVELRRYGDGEQMLALDRKYFGSRYVEVSLSTLEEQHRLTGAV